MVSAKRTVTLRGGKISKQAAKITSLKKKINFLTRKDRLWREVFKQQYAVVREYRNSHGHIYSTLANNGINPMQELKDGRFEALHVWVTRGKKALGRLLTRLRNNYDEDIQSVSSESSESETEEPTTTEANSTSANVKN